ncbi:unnamed protein product [Lota lota]
MNPLDFLDEDKLQVFFRRNKTEMSCMDKPHTFLNQLRDHKLILEERYKKVIRIKNKNKMKTSVYELLDWIETEQTRNIRLFWTCVFKDIIMTQYPTLMRLRDSLFDGSFQFSDDEDSGERTSEGLSEDDYMEKERGERGKRVSFCDQDDQQGDSSSQATPRKRKKLMKPTFGSLPKGENAEIWKWHLYRNHLPVTCGDQEGTLYRTKLAKGEPCILISQKWYTPNARLRRRAGSKAARTGSRVFVAGTPR